MSRPPAARIGVVGAGQLARMMLPAAIELDLPVRVLAADPAESAARVAGDVRPGRHDDEEAVRLANDVQYGLTGSVWSSDLDRATQIADRLDVGNVMINEHGTSLPGLPFGGVKASGYGRELGQWGLGEFANVRLRRVTGAK